jgi:hypothetical protein
MCNNLCNKGERISGLLTVDKLDNANLYWIKWGQGNRFRDEIEVLRKGRPVPRDSRIASLDPQLMDGVLRVGGRIEKAEIPWESKHPVILDHRHDVTRLIVIHYHRNLSTRESNMSLITYVRNTGFCTVEPKLRTVQSSAHYVFTVVLNL